MDFLQGILKSLTDAWASLETAMSGSPTLASIGLILAAGAALVLGLALLVGLVRLVFAMRRSALAAKVRRDDDVGARIVVVRGGKGRRNAISAFLGKSIEHHLKDYMFGGPFRISPIPAISRATSAPTS